MWTREEVCRYVVQISSRNANNWIYDIYKCVQDCIQFRMV